ncbi:MAG: PD-(D/E)XK nuclease family protein [Lachnospiraceae bacterium]
MGLQFVFGSSGSGKTHYLYKKAVDTAAADPKAMVLFMVPEQFTMQAQKEIITIHPSHGMMNIDVLSFRRLAYRVFEELSVKNLTILDDMGKSMVLRKVAAAKKAELGLYQSHLSKNGFINQLKSMLSELYQYGITRGQLEELLEQADRPLLRHKLQDMLVIYKGFQDYIEDRFSTAEEILETLCTVLPKSEFIKNSSIYLDGYTGFTPIQYRIIGLLLQYTKNVTISITIDPNADPYTEESIQHLFYMGKHTVSRIEKLAEKEKIFKKKDFCLKGHPRFRHAPALAFLEKNLFRGFAPFREQEGERPVSDQIWIYKAVSPAEEVQFLVSQIQQSVRKEGLRYRDIGVITGDLNGYGKEISHQFKEAGIPCFIDDKRDITENLLVEWIRSLLAVISEDFSYESVFRYLKCGLSESTLEEPALETSEDEESPFSQTDLWDARVVPWKDSFMVDRLENYVRALGIRGYSRWNIQWEWTYRGAANINLEELNRFREAVLAPVCSFRQAFLEEGATVASITERLKQYLEESGVREKLEWYQRQFESRGQESLAKEYSQAWDLVAELFERLTALLGEERVSRKEYAEILDAGFEEIQVGAIPAVIDRVVVGDITRTRLNEVRILFFLGVNEGIIPQKKERQSILTDQDREFFAAHSLELAPTAREDGCIQRFYQYLILSKPSFRLILTFACLSPDGQARRPSSLLGDVRHLFPQLKILEKEDVSWPIQSEREGIRRLIKGLTDSQETGEKKETLFSPEFLELYKWFLSDEHWQEAVYRITEAAFTSYEEKGIGKAAARALYGTILQGSVTRFEQYASCAYAHFLKYGLELMERQEYEVAASDMGNLFHQSIELCFQTARDQNMDWARLSDKERKNLVRECVRQVAEEYGNTILKSSARNAYLTERIERITDRTIWALAEQIKKGDFIPVGFEVSFSAIDNLKAMKISLSDEEELHLKGRIDRLDLCEDENHVYVKIIDYKSGNTSFDLAALYYGLQLQLVVYMDAAVEQEEKKHPDKEVVPAGMFYYHINDPVVDWDPDEEDESIEEKILKKLRMSGLADSELEVIRRMDREIEKESQVIPVAMKDGLVAEGKSSVANRRRFQALRQYVHEKLKTAGQEILSGTVPVNPYKQGNRTGCDYCPYHAVCGFDRKTAGYGYRRLRSLKTEDIWNKIEEQQKGEETCQ